MRDAIEIGRGLMSQNLIRGLLLASVACALGTTLGCLTVTGSDRGPDAGDTGPDGGPDAGDGGPTLDAGTCRIDDG